MQVTFEIPGPPKGKPRPRFARMGNFIKTYTPKDGEQYENLVKMAFRDIYKESPTPEAVKVSVRAYFPIPLSWPKYKRESAMDSSMPIPVTVKPDVDNILKSILDGLNGVAWVDDKQVYSVSCRKYYSDNPRTVVLIQTDRE